MTYRQDEIPRGKVKSSYPRKLKPEGEVLVTRRNKTFGIALPDKYKRYAVGIATALGITPEPEDKMSMLTERCVMTYKLREKY